MLAGPLDFLIESQSIPLSGGGKGRIRKEKQTICVVGPRNSATFAIRRRW
jgi:hypothetical protein